MTVAQRVHQQGRPHGGPAERAGRAPVLILCPGLFSVRNVVHSRMLPALRALGQPVHILASAPGGAPPALPAPGPDQVYAGLPAPSRRGSRRLRAMDVVQRASFFRRHRLATHRLTSWWYRRGESSLNRLQHELLETLALPGSRSPFYRWQMNYMARLRRASWDLRPIREQLGAIRPSLVVATSCINLAEEPFLLAAADLGIPTLGCIQSFDHLTDRSYVADCDHFAVWNERMRSQLLRYHRVRVPSQIHVTGTAQFDFHAQDEFRWPRDETLTRLGLAPGDRYILYAANTHPVTPSEPALVEEFSRRCAQARELAGHRIVVRLHPNDDFERWNDLGRADHRIVLSRPSVRPESFAAAGDQARLVSTLLHADVCLNVWSSMSLDATAVGTPVVCVGFARGRDPLEDRFCRMVYAVDFYRPIIESGGVRLATSMDELVAETAAYVADPARDAAERASLAAGECGPLDGGSAERVAALIARIAAGWAA